MKTLKRLARLTPASACYVITERAAETGSACIIREVLPYSGQMPDVAHLIGRRFARPQLASRAVVAVMKREADL